MASWLLGALALPVHPASATAADAATAACHHILRQLSTFEGSLYRSGPETFEDAGKIYRGCAVTVVGDRRKVPGGSPPADAPYPKPDSAATAAGWKADREADGPDGTSYRLSRGDVFCLISGWWDGGDDSNPKASPSPLFLITARCAQTG